MNRRSFLRNTAVLGAPLLAMPLAASGTAAAPAEKQFSESQRRITRATAAALAMQRKDWEPVSYTHLVMSILTAEKPRTA